MMKLKKKVLIMLLIAGILVLATNAFALNPGDPFTFSNTVPPGATTSWTHNLLNTDFAPNLSGSEPLIITSATDSLNFTFTPASISIPGLPPFYVEIQVLTLDGYYTGSTYTYGSSSSSQVTTYLPAPITGLDALNSIADKAAGMKLHAVYGTVNSVNSSMLSGSGVVAPEPISMLLVGAGMAGLPLAGRFRRFKRFVRKMCRLKPGQP